MKLFLTISALAAILTASLTSSVHLPHQVASTNQQRILCAGVLTREYDCPEMLRGTTAFNAVPAMLINWVAPTAQAGEMSAVDIFNLSAQQAFDKGQRIWAVALEPGAILKKRFETTMLDLTGVTHKTHIWEIKGGPKQWRFRTWDRKTWKGEHYIATFKQ